MERPEPKKMKKRTMLLVLAVVVIGLTVAALLYGGTLWDLFSSRERIETTIKDAGPWGPLILILLQILQVVVAPIPGQVVAFVSGFLFGTVLGTVYTMIGATIGFTLVIASSRWLGRPFVEYFVNKKTLKKFDYIAESNGVFIFFLMALLPFFPDDIICFIAGLTRIPVRTLVVVTFLGRLPTNLIYAFAGEGVAKANTELVIWVLAVGLVLAAITWWKRDALEQLARKFSKPDKP